MGKALLWVVLALIILGAGWLVARRIMALTGGETGRPRGEAGPAPVEVAPIERGVITRTRVFSGTLESPASVVVAPKVAGRIERIAVDLADTVTRGQVVAELDDDEFEQAVAQAEAELAVARAERSNARSQSDLAKRELARVKTLAGEGVSSEAQLDVAEANAQARAAAVDVADAQVTRAEAALKSAQIRLGYTQVAARWTGGDARRVVDERYADEGDTVAANAPLLRIVELDPIEAVVYVTEKDYAWLRPKQQVTLTTDARPGEAFVGQINRIAPVFERASRQARVEITVPNPDRKLSPGMFVRAKTILERQEDATIVPDTALVNRNDQTGVFIVTDAGRSVKWCPVEVGIREGARVQVSGEGLEGRVVTLGQQLVSDGSPITVPASDPAGRPSRGSERDSD